MRIIAALIAIGVFTGYSQGQAPMSPHKAVKAVKSTKKLCRPGDDTGTIMPTVICHTAAEWAAIDAQHQNDSEEFLIRRNSATSVNGPVKPKAE